MPEAAGASWPSRPLAGLWKLLEGSLKHGRAPRSLEKPKASTEALGLPAEATALEDIETAARQGRVAKLWQGLELSVVTSLNCEPRSPTATTWNTPQAPITGSP